jgi:hypothetical protein
VKRRSCFGISTGSNEPLRSRGPHATSPDTEFLTRSDESMSP